MPNFLRNNLTKIAALGVIFILGAGLRFYNLNWDQNQHLHPDERFLTMVAAGISWPTNLNEYFSTATSPLNPFTHGFPFFVYGTFPLFLTKALAEIFNMTSYDDFTVFGRGLSAFFDLLTMAVIYLLAARHFSKPAALLAAFLYTLAVLAIQLAHYFTVDTFLNFFMITSLYFLLSLPSRPNVLSLIAGAVCLGLALSSKVTALLMFPALVPIFGLLILRYKRRGVTLLLVFLFLSLAVFRIGQPYAFSGPAFYNLGLNPDFTKSLIDLGKLASPGTFYPPSIQWYGTLPLIYPLKNLIFWGLGLPLGILSLLALGVVIFQLIKQLPRSKDKIISTDQQYLALSALVILILTVFFYQGLQFAKPLRYLLPMLPPLLIIAAYFINNQHRALIGRAYQKYVDLLLYFLVFTLFAWPISFISIYSHPTTRVLASEWIYQNIPTGSKVLTEYWDDSLPLSLNSQYTSQLYPAQQLSLFDPDTPEKWLKVTGQLESSDYIIISSNRVYAAVVKLPDRYPVTINYYQRLSDGSLGYNKIAEFTSYPSFLGFEANDDNADENYTVFDHPKVIIFKKTVDLSQSDMLATLHQSRADRAQ